MAKVGRPRKAATSVAEALQMKQRGETPARPRSDAERVVFGKRRGRRPDPNSKTQQAALLASHFHKDGLSLQDAVKQAAQMWGGVDLANVRRYAKKLISGPQVELPHHGGWYGQLPARTVPLVVFVKDDDDAPADSEDARPAVP